VTAYVSVTDQGGFPVKQLTRDNFAVMQSNTTLPIVSSAFVETMNAPIAIAALMDHSSSLTSQPIALADMKSGLSSLVAGLRPGDIAEIVTFDDRVVVVQPFTSDTSLLLAAIIAPFEVRSGTSLYDSVYQAADDIAIKTSFRRAIVVTTDGVDTRSRRGLSEAIANALNKKVPVFAIGIGSAIDRNVLMQLAAETGGQFYEANTSQNLASVYQQLSSLLYVNQYVMKFDQLSRGSANVVSDVSIRVTLDSASDVSTKSVVSCN
jgi:VWFA-related protein